jgi:CRISP-associated protein Cas1
MSESPLGRLVEIAEDGRHLRKERGFLIVSAAKEEIGRVPLDDITAVIATALGTTTSCALMAELAERGIPLVLCGSNFAPSAIVWPLSAHFEQQRRMEAQIDRTRPLGKRLWAQLVSAKIRRQGAALEEVGETGGAFFRLARQVRAGDPDNIEAQAARRYWPLMFGKSFRRDVDGAGVNAYLNYGYAVLRAGTARAIVAAGLHPGIGIFHRHPRNAMPLADDLMEPFRAIVDLRVRDLVASGATELESAEKRALASVLMWEEKTNAGNTPLSTCLIRLAQSISASYQTGKTTIDLPILGNSRSTKAKREGTDAL